MIDHIGLHVRDVARATEFYLKALAPLGIGIVMQVSAEETGHGAAVGFGAGLKPFFWIGEGEAPSGPLHVAFAADSRAAVDAFYHAALQAGGTDNGPPGPPARISRQLLRRLRARSRRQQYRGGLPPAGVRSGPHHGRVQLGSEKTQGFGGVT